MENLIMGFLLGSISGIFFAKRWFIERDIKDNSKPTPSVPRMRNPPPPPNKCYRPTVDNTTNPPLRDTNTYLENGVKVNYIHYDSNTYIKRN